MTNALRDLRAGEFSLDPKVVAKISNLSKSYGGVRALDDVSFELRRGEIHALCGENGAGKSTLIKCLSGVVVPDCGEIIVGDSPLEFGNVRASEAARIAVIHQESTAFPDLSTIDNVFVGREPKKWMRLFVDRQQMIDETASTLQRLNQDFDIHRPVGEMSVANRQMVAMARALSQDCRLLIMDEPTASLSARETDVLLGIAKRLRDEGVTILYVSHRLEEVFELANRVTVFRDGKYVDTKNIADVNRNDLINMMVGREVDELTKRHEHDGAIGDVRLEVDRLSSPGQFQDISFHVRAGEIVGLAGLVGAGRSEVAKAIFGIDNYAAGAVKVDGQLLPKNCVQSALNSGLGLVPEDRQHEGLVLPMSVGQNISMAVLKRLSIAGIVKTNSEKSLIGELVDRLSVKASSHEIAVETLSGGNQQKVVLGKWLASEPRVLILDEPTRGVDVGAKSQVHQLIRNLAADGMATLVISSELNELISICDRIIVMREGRISGEREGRSTTQQELLDLALPNESIQDEPARA